MCFILSCIDHVVRFRPGICGRTSSSTLNIPRFGMTGPRRAVHRKMIFRKEEQVDGSGGDTICRVGVRELLSRQNLEHDAHRPYPYDKNCFAPISDPEIEISYLAWCFNFQGKSCNCQSRMGTRAMFGWWYNSLIRRWRSHVLVEHVLGAWNASPWAFMQINVRWRWIFRVVHVWGGTAMMKVGQMLHRLVNGV
jgi:hypothetical protein